jgi:uncharacterized protein (TIGR01777 family)
MATVLISGGTGLVGSALTALLTKHGHDVIILSRSIRKSNTAKVTYAVWDIDKQTVDKSAISKTDYIIHLAGAGVADKRWTEKRKQEIVDSRTKSSALLVQSLREIPNNVKAVISASAIGYYGADKIRDKKKLFTEDMSADPSFLGSTCKQWEQCIQPVQGLGKRLVILRTGIVLSNEGGALPEFQKPLRFGIAALLGGGKQVISWIHIDDLCRLYLFAIENNGLSGVYNAVAPAPVSNKELTLNLAQRLRGRFYVPVHVPGFVLKIVLGEMSIEVLKSATVSNDKIRSAGFQFLYPSINAALDALDCKGSK